MQVETYVTFESIRQFVVGKPDYSSIIFAQPGHLTELYSLEAAHNILNAVEDISHLIMCSSIEILDLSSNRLDDPKIIDVFAEMPHLGVLSLTGNPVVGKIPSYRKTLIYRIKTLNHLDGTPVFPRDRACAEAW